RGGVVSLEVVARVGLGDPEALRLLERARERVAGGAPADDVVARARHDPAYRAYLRERQRTAAQREHRKAVRERRLESQHPAARAGEGVEVEKGARARPLFRRPDVHARLERLADVRDRGLAGLRVERRDLDDDIGG